MTSTLGSRRDSGFTLVELLVVIAIIGILVGMLMPALSMAREASRRSSCLNNLSQIGKAFAAYDADKTLLPGWRNSLDTYTSQKVAADDKPRAMVSWAVMILPFFDQRDIYDWHETYTTGTAVDEVSKKRIPSYVCPSASSDLKGGPLTYMGNGGTAGETLNGAEQWRGDGVFLDTAGNAASASWQIVESGSAYNPARSSLTQIGAADGTGSTLLVAERSGLMAPADSAWADRPRPASGASWAQHPLSGTSTNVQVMTHLIMHPPELAVNQDPVAGKRTINPTAETAAGNATDWEMRFPSSRHPGGACVVFCDAHTRFLSEKIEPWVYSQMLTSNKRLRSERARRWETYVIQGERVQYIFDENDINK